MARNVCLQKENAAVASCNAAFKYVIRLGAKFLCLQALIFRELRVLLFQSVPILVPLLDPPALTRPLMCGNVLQS